MLFFFSNSCTWCWLTFLHSLTHPDISPVEGSTIHIQWIVGYWTKACLQNEAVSCLKTLLLFTALRQYSLLHNIKSQHSTEPNKCIIISRMFASNWTLTKLMWKSKFPLISHGPKFNLEQWNHSPWITDVQQAVILINLICHLCISIPNVKYIQLTVMLHYHNNSQKALWTSLRKWVWPKFYCFIIQWHFANKLLMVTNFETPLKIRVGNKTSISYYGRPM